MVCVVELRIQKYWSKELYLVAGCHMETLVYDNITLNAWDVSGAHKTRLQGIHFEETKGLIFVVDSTARDKLDRAKRELHMLLNEDLLKDVFLLVFANKQDVPKRMNEADITEMLGLSSPIPQRHRRVQITCATSGEGLYEGLDWLSKKIKHTCATSREGVSEGLNWLRNSSANRNYDDMSTGCTFQPTDEELVDFLVRLIDGKDIYPDRVGRVNLFDNHPAVIIRNFSRSHDLLPCMLDTCKYYLFYCKVPDDAICCGLGYHEIQDQAKGVWEPISYSFVFPCTLFDGTERLGEVQKFRYKPVNEATSCWRMDMYGLPDFPRPQPNMVICKVFESAKSKNALAVRSIASGTREVQDALNRRSTHRAKIKLLEVATREEMTKEDSLEVATLEEMTKEDSCQVELGVKVQQLIKMVKKYDRDEHKEADAIDPPNRKRTSCVSAHTSSL